MGRIFALPPSPFEADHVGAYLAGLASVEATGDLPAGPMWAMLGRRYDLDAARFAAWHPNFAALIGRSRDASPRPDMWPIDRPNIFVPTSCAQQQPPSGPTRPQVVPEPPSVVGVVLGLVSAFIVTCAVNWSEGRRSR